MTTETKKRVYPEKTMTPREQLKARKFYLAPVKFKGELADLMLTEMETAPFGAGVSQVVEKRMLDSYNREKAEKAKAAKKTAKVKK